MANQNTQDIQLRIQTAVDGLQDIGKLLSELDELGGDTSAASQDVERLNAEMQSLSQQRSLLDALQRTRDRVDEASQAMQEAEGQAAELRRAYDQNAQGVEAQRRAAQQAAESATQASEAYREQQRALQALQTQYKGVQQSTTGARQAWRDAAQRVQDLEEAISASGGATAEQSRQLDEARGAADQARRSYEAQAESLSGLRDQLQDQRRGVDQAKRAWEEYRDQSRQLNRELKTSEKALSSQGKELGRADQAADKARTAFERQGQSLDELAEDARAAGIDVNNLADEQDRLQRESRDLEAGVDSLKGRLREYRQQVDGTAGSVRNLGRSLANGVKRFGAWTAAVAAGGAALAVGVLTRYTAAQAQVAQQLDNTSQAIGVNAQRLQELQYAFERVGIDGDKTGDLLKDVADKIGDAYTNGGGEAKDAIDTLGLSLNDLIRMSPDEQLLAIADALDRLPPASQVNVMESLANDASLLLPLLRDNAAGLRELSAEANQVGAILDPDEIANLQATNDAVQRLQGRLQGLRNRLIGEVSPAVNDLADSFEDLLEDNPGLVDDLAQVFRGLIQQTQRWMDYVITNRERVGAALQSLIDTAQFLGNSFIAAFRGVQSAVSAVLAGVAQAYTHVRSLMEGVTRALNAVGLASDETLRRMEAHSAAAQEAVRELEQQTVEYGRQALQAGRNAINAYDNTATAAENSAERQREANASVATVVDEATAAEWRRARIIREVQQQIAAAETELASYQQRLRDDPSSETAQKVGDLQVQLRRLRGELRQLRGDSDDATIGLENAAQAIGTTLEQLRTGIRQSARQAIEGFGDLARRGELTAEQLAEAFQRTWEQLDSKEEREAFQERLRQLADEGVDGAGRWLSAWQVAFAETADGADGMADSVAGSLGRITRAASDAASATTSSSKAAADGARSVGEASEDAADKTEGATKRMRRSYTLNWRDILAQVERVGVIAATTVQLANANWQRAANQRARRLIDWARQQKAAHDEAEQSVKNLDEQSLDGLRRSAAGVREEFEGVRDSITGTVDSLRQELAGLRGDQAEVERLRYAQRQLELEEALAQARRANDAEAQRQAREALRLAEEVHRVRMRNLREEGGTRQAAGQGPVAGPAVPAQAAQPTRRVQIDISGADGSQATLYADDDLEAERAIRALRSAQRRS